MGSNPISPTILVLDTSPLQALYRAGLIQVLRSIFERVLVPSAVYRETQASLALAKAGLVPNMEEFPWIEVHAVNETELALVGAVRLQKRRASDVYTWFDRKIDRPEIEAILLAKRESAVAAIEDSKGVRCARDFGVPLIDVAGILLRLEEARHIPDASASASKIMQTGYYSRELRFLAWRGRR